MAASNSNQSNYGLVGPSMSKWTRNVSTAAMVLMMVVICVLPTAIEGKSIYGEEAAAAAAQHEVGALEREHERQQQQQFGLEKSGGIGDLDYAAGRDEYDGAAAPAVVENPLLNYFYTRQMLQRLRPGSAAAAAFFDQPYASYYLSPQQQQLEGIRKRTSTYWKQCAFNAVSCFGRK